ncbi:MAG: M48 family metalloprotease [Rhodospirillaceae bacterium]|nr:M48 family metalloprotease [Rhodospirillaceae bacterium]
MIRSIAILLAASVAATLPASANARSLALIRDAEIERTIRTYTTPMFSSIGVKQNSVRVHIVNDSRINAFVAGGRYIFINTGLLMYAKDAGMVIGVLAHEMGHIVGQHLTRLRGAISESQIKQIIAFILAASTGVATRDGQAAGAIASLGGNIVRGTLYRYTRGMEAEADEFALTTLDRMGVSARGLASLMQHLMSQEALLPSMQDPYMRTHPLSRSRLERIKRHMKTSRFTSQPTPVRYRKLHRRMRAKLFGFLKPPASVLARYGPNNRSLEARYAIAVAYHRSSRLNDALATIDDLIREEPRDPFFHELKGQILLESGRAQQAIKSYSAAIRLAPSEALIRGAYAHALLQTGDRSKVPTALRHLITVTVNDKTFPTGWRLRAIAHGHLKQIGESAAALAEYYLLLGDLAEARRQIRRAERLLPAGSPSWQRVQDMKSARLDSKGRR